MKDLTDFEDYKFSSWDKGREKQSYERYVQRKLDDYGGYDKYGYVYSFAKPSKAFDGFRAKNFSGRPEIETFIKELTFLRFSYSRASWRAILKDNEFLSDEEALSNTLKGQSYTPERGKEYIIDLIDSGQLQVYETGTFIPLEDRNHNKPPKPPESALEEPLKRTDKPSDMGVESFNASQQSVVTSSKMTREEAQAYCTKRADEIRDNIAENYGERTANNIVVAVAVVENSQGQQRVVVTTSSDPDGRLPKQSQGSLKSGETNPKTSPIIRTRKGQQVEIDPDTGETIGPYKKGTANNNYDGDTRNHSEQRMNNGGALTEDEEIIGMSHSNKKGCCPGCKEALGDDIDLVDPNRLGNM